MSNQGIGPRIFLGPRGGLVIALRRDRPVIISLENDEKTDLHPCIGNQQNQNASWRVEQPAILGLQPVFPDDEVRYRDESSDAKASTDGESFQLLLRPEQAPQVSEYGPQFWRILDDRLYELQDCVGGPLGRADAVDCAGQSFGNEFACELLKWLQHGNMPVRSLDFSGCDLTDEILDPLKECVMAWPWLKYLGLAENRLITRNGVWNFLLGISGKHRQDIPLHVDVAYNAIDDPLSLSQHGWPTFLLVNVGPAWNKVEAERASSFGTSVKSRERAEAWHRFTNGSLNLLAATLHEQVNASYCDICRCSLIPSAAATEDPVLFRDHIWTHVRGRAHRECAYAAEDSAQMLSFHLLDGSTYWYHCLTGTQGWNFENASWIRDSCDFKRHPDELCAPHFWTTDRSCSHADSKPRDGILSEGVSFSDLEWLLRAVKQGAVDVNLDGVNGVPGYFELPEEFRCDAVFEAADEDDVGSWPLCFRWRAFLEAHLDRYAKAFEVFGAGPSENMRAFLEVHQTAQDFMRTPRVYLTIQISDEVIAHILPRASPLFAEAKTGFLLGFGDNRCDPILASRSTEVLEAFKGSGDKLRRRGRIRAKRGHAGANDSFKDDVEKFLDEEGATLTSLVHDKRVFMDPVSHCFEVDPELAQRFWLWLARDGGPSHVADCSELQDVNRVRIAQVSADRDNEQRHPKHDFVAFANFSESIRSLCEKIRKMKRLYDFGLWWCDVCHHEHRYFTRCGHTWYCQLCELMVELLKWRQLFQEAKYSQHDLLDLTCELNSCEEALKNHGVFTFGFDKLSNELENFFDVRDCHVPVSQIRATHDAISDTFCHGHRGQPLSILIDALRSGTLNLAHGGFRIEGSFYQGKFHSISNRRTFCLWAAFGKDSMQMVPVRAYPLALQGPDGRQYRTELNQPYLHKFHTASTSQCNGEHLHVRGRGLMLGTRIRCASAASNAGHVFTHALADFVSDDYGSEYVSLCVGEQVELLQAPDGQQADEAWSYGRAEAHGIGWFPTKFVTVCS